LAGLACPLGPASRESVAPCPRAASFTGNRLTSRCLHPSPRLADMQAAPSHLPPRADHCYRCLACARAASLRCFRSRNSRSNQPHCSPHHPSRSPSETAGFITIMAHHRHRPLLFDARLPRSPSDPIKGCPASAPPTTPPPPLLPLSQCPKRACTERSSTAAFTVVVPPPSEPR
jgi:hypothetical protein